ncbi:hypothetical protein B0H13DRAFT_2372179 [Mycena leptocephala]|nr:hypothetical protein B0H13DRAFT_2372179 [Mycena leptocephala]
MTSRILCETHWSSFLVVALDLLSGLVQGLGMELQPLINASSLNLLALLTVFLKHLQLLCADAVPVYAGDYDLDDEDFADEMLTEWNLRKCTAAVRVAHFGRISVLGAMAEGRIEAIEPHLTRLEPVAIGKPSLSITDRTTVFDLLGLDGSSLSSDDPLSDPKTSIESLRVSPQLVLADSARRLASVYISGCSPSLRRTVCGYRATDERYNAHGRKSTSLLRWRHLFRAHARHVAFQLDQWEQIIPILSVCDATTSLALDTWDTPLPLSNFLPLLGSIQLRRLRLLSLYLPNLFPELTRTDFGHPLFSHVTHITILDSPLAASWSGVALIPWLSNAMCECALRDCKLFETLLVVCWSRKWLGRAVPARAELGVDPRSVMVVV